MPNSTGTPILIAAGAVASILIAFSGRRATRKTVVVRKRRRREAGRLPQNGVAPHNAPTTLDGALAEESNQTSRQSSRSAIPLLLHGLISIGLVFCASHWHPTIINDVESWRQLVGSILIAILTVHASIFYLVPSRPPRVVLAPPPPLITARPETIEALNGVWIKDKQASDSMDAVCDLMKMNGLLRMAIGLIKGVEILAIPGEDFKLDVLSGVLWFKIKEKYKLTGEEARHRRRDLRGGELAVENILCSILFHFSSILVLILA